MQVKSANGRIIYERIGHQSPSINCKNKCAEAIIRTGDAETRSRIMPRDLPLGNGSLLAAYDSRYQIRDLYWPHVGQENHAMGHPFRVGVWVDNQFRWLDDDRWQRQLRYSHDTLVTDVNLHHPDLNITLEFNDAVDFHENLLVRRLDATNDSDSQRTIRLFFHQDFHIL